LEHLNSFIILMTPKESIHGQNLKTIKTKIRPIIINIGAIFVKSSIELN